MTVAEENFDLPIVGLLDEIKSTLLEDRNLVIIAPPGAGKTTLVPLALLDAKWRSGSKIIMLEPRRLAASSAARRMSELIGETVGNTVGYRIRFETRVSSNTQIEVVTEGVLLRMLAQDPGLEGVAAVIFDEIHERNLDSDLSLTLCLDLQTGLREDLRLLAMSATVDGAAVSGTLSAPVIESKGRSYPVEVSYCPRLPGSLIETDAAQVILRELQNSDSGSLLVFLPGQREIERTFQNIESKLPAQVSAHKLYGSIDWSAQRSAISAPSKGHRKVVLSTDIAETSLTIEGVRTVIDSGLARRPVFEPSTGLTRLQTVRISQSSATQRAGRAGRLEAGRAVRLWHEGQTRAMPMHDIPEIMNSDLTSLVLNLAEWGVSDPQTLCWLSPPPETAFEEARALLKRLGALSDQNLMTVHGRMMGKTGLNPRLAHLVVRVADIAPHQTRTAATLALLLQERGLGGRSIDVTQRLGSCLRSRDGRAKKVIAAAKSITDRLDVKTNQNQTGELSQGLMLAFAYPDRIAQQMGASQQGLVRYRLVNGRGAEIEASQSLAAEPFLVVADMIGRAGAARIVSAAPVSKSEIENHFGDQIEIGSKRQFDSQTGAVTQLAWSKLGRLRLSQPVQVPLSIDENRQAYAEAIKTHGLTGLPWRDSDRELKDRLNFFQHLNPKLLAPFDDETLQTDVDEWLGPFLGDIRSLKQLSRGQIGDALMFRAGPEFSHRLKTLLPKRYTTPAGSSLRIDYHPHKAVLAVKPQELFGLDSHPTIADGKVRLELQLVSPAGRPIQITTDLPGFWRGSWQDVRKDLRGRYPKHAWPEDPLSAQPTQRAKPRGSK